MFGFLNVNKPKGKTSAEVVYDLRKILKIKQIGHSGTLDPLASGVLPVAIGKATKLIEYLPQKKSYLAKCELGKVSNTFDIEGELKTFCDIELLNNVNEKRIQCALKKFEGETVQKVPVFSAVKVNGKKLYELARKGQKIENVPERKIFIEKILLENYDKKTFSAEVSINCNSGVYVRSIIHDLGLSLATGAVMTDLQRTFSNGFSISDSVKLCELNYENILKNLKNPLDVLSYRKKILDEKQFARVKNGNFIENDCFEEGEIILTTFKGQVVSISKIFDNKIKTEKVFV